MDSDKVIEALLGEIEFLRSELIKCKLELDAKKSTEEITITVPVKVKNPNRVAGGKKAAETRKLKAEMKKNEEMAITAFQSLEILD